MASSKALLASAALVAAVCHPCAPLLVRDPVCAPLRRALPVRRPLSIRLHHSPADQPRGRHRPLVAGAGGAPQLTRRRRNSQALPASAFSGSLAAAPSLRANARAVAAPAAVSMSAARDGAQMRRAFLRAGAAAVSTALLTQVPAFAGTNSEKSPS
jgi:hypothetical protein